MIPGIFPPPLFATTTGTSEQSQKPQPPPQKNHCSTTFGHSSLSFDNSLSPPPSSPSPIPPISNSCLVQRHQAFELHKHNLYRTAPEVDEELEFVGDCPSTPMFHHPSLPNHGNHPLNRISSYQKHSSSGNPTSGTFSASITSMNPSQEITSSSSSSSDIDLDEHQDPMPEVKLRQPQPDVVKLHHQLDLKNCERRYILSSPPKYTRIRKLSDNLSQTPNHIILHNHLMAKTEEKPRAVSTTYEDILKQIATQRSRLSALDAGAQALSQDISTLDNKLDEEQDSMNTAIKEARAAIKGWKDIWDDHSKCEPLQALQDKPNILAMLIQSMNLQDKKDLFGQIVTNCRPREIYFLQDQMIARHGIVTGFDLLKEFPSLVSKHIMTYLTFPDLANCRLVSRNWRHVATAFAVILSAVNRLTFASEAISLESLDESKENWNQLCRYHERNIRWIKGKPASLHAMLGHTSYVTSLKCRGDWIVSGGYDEKVRLWEASTGKCMKIWEVDSAVSCVELFVDSNIEGGGVVVAAFVDIGLVKIWSLHGPLNMHTLSGHQKGVRAIAINEIYLVTAGFDQTVLVWNWMTGQKIASFRAHNEVILGVHLSNNILYTFCIDATLRVFDIPTKTLLYQAKLFDVQQGSSLQWSYLQGRMFLTATSRKVYVWQLEQLESLHQQHHLRLSFRSSFASATSSENNGSSTSVDSQSNYLEIDSQSRSRSRSPSRSRSTSPFNYLTPPETPSSTSFSSSCSSYFYCMPSGASSASSLQTDFLNRSGSFPTVDETKIKPCLTAILNMTMDMWCGKVTHHDPPLLILGSRSAPVKLVALELTKDIIDPNKVYTHDDIPQLISPKIFPVQGMPAGHGRGVMCIDSDTNKLVVGCTGGSIHAFYMDPAKRTLGSSRRISVVPQVVILPHEAPALQLNPSQLAALGQSSSSLVNAVYADEPSYMPSDAPLSASPSTPSTVSLNASTSKILSPLAIAPTDKLTGTSAPLVVSVPASKSVSTPALASASTSESISVSSSVSAPTLIPTPIPTSTSTSANTITIPVTPRRASVTKTTQPKKMVISTSNTPLTARRSSFALPTPDQSPRRSSIPIVLPTPNSRGIRSSSPPRRRTTTIRHPPTPPSDFEEQEVLVDFEEDLISNVIRSNLLLQGASNLGFGGDSQSRNLNEPNNAGQGRRNSLPLSSRSLTQRVTGTGKTTAPSSSSTSHTLSSLSKFMPGPTSRMMLRRRSTFLGSTEKAAEPKATVTLAPAPSKPEKNTPKSSTNAPASSASSSSIMKWRSRSDPNLLSGSQGSPATAAAPVASPAVDSTATKRLSKSWSLSSAWNSPSRRASKSKAT